MDIYTSTDGGSTWTEQNSTGLKNWSQLSTSMDGVKLFSLNSDGYVYKSNDGGKVWTKQFVLGNKNWKSIDSSSSGEYIIVASNLSFRSIYTYHNSLPEAQNVTIEE